MIFNKRRAVGFTLIEMLIALAIVAILALLAWRGLEEVLRSARRVNEVDGQLQTTAAIFSQFKTDLSHAELSDQRRYFPNDAVQVDQNGLTLLVTQRPAEKPAYQERIQWTLNNGALIRTSQVQNQTDPAPTVQSAPIAMKGMAIRFWLEPGGWSALTSFGQNADLGGFQVDFQGVANTLELSTTQVGSGSNAPAAPTGTDTQSQPLIRAVEVTLTQPNAQAVRQLFITGTIQ